MIQTRSSVVSSFTIIKGSLIEETYAAFKNWDNIADKQANLRRLKEQNFLGAGSSNWLRDVAFVLSRRFDPAGRDRALVDLAQRVLVLEMTNRRVTTVDIDDILTRLERLEST